MSAIHICGVQKQLPFGFLAPHPDEPPRKALEEAGWAQQVHALVPAAAGEMQPLLRVLPAEEQLRLRAVRVELVVRGEDHLWARGNLQGRGGG